MLLNFRVANFRSINEMIELSMVPNDLKNQVNVIHRTNPNATKNKDYYGLTSAAIYGANASGKSNIIKAFYEFQRFISNSTDNKPFDQIKLYSPFKLIPENLGKPSCFSIDIVLNDVLYNYSIEVLGYIIVKENLYVYPKGIKVKVFERDLQEITKGNGYDGVFEIIKQRTTENQLFLSKAASENIDFAKVLYLGIDNLSAFPTELFHSDIYNKIANKAVFNNFKDGHQIIDLSKSLIKKLDTQVVDFDENEGKVRTFHLSSNNMKIEFEFEEESSGTQRAISFMPVVFSILKTGKTLIVDEFERSLHPDIAQYILSLFNDPEVNKNGAQFIFATHDTTLLSPENKLRRDQINLVEKNSKGETELYSVSDIKGIREGNYEKWYLEGRFGAVPNIARETFRHELIDFINS